MLIFVIFLSMPEVIAQPMPPCVFYGDVKDEEGMLAPDGLIVKARIAGTNLEWTTETKNGTYGFFNDPIDSDSPDTPEKDGGTNGDKIEFYVSEIKAGQTATFESGDVKRVDLSVSEMPEGPTDNLFLNNPYLYAILIVIAIILVTFFLIHRKGYRIRVSKRI